MAKGYFKVEEIAGEPIAQAVSKLADDALKTELSAVDWNKVPFEYIVHTTKEDALKGYTDKDLLELLNSVEKANAKAKEYQRITKPMRPDLSTPEAKKEAIIKKFTKDFNVDEATARTTVEALIASGAVSTQ